MCGPRPRRPRSPRPAARQRHQDGRSPRERTGTHVRAWARQQRSLERVATAAPRRDPGDARRAQRSMRTARAPSRHGPIPVCRHELATGHRRRSRHPACRRPLNERIHRLRARRGHGGRWPAGPTGPGGPHARIPPPDSDEPRSVASPVRVGLPRETCRIPGPDAPVAVILTRRRDPAGRPPPPRSLPSRPRRLPSAGPERPARVSPPPAMHAWNRPPGGQRTRTLGGGQPNTGLPRPERGDL